jgi:lambda family phage portal protein
MPAAAQKPGIISRLIDAAVATLSPERAVRRSQARARLLLQAAPELRHAAKERQVAALRYEAARLDRLRTKLSSGSADGDLLPDLDTLRQKSQALVRDDAHASAAVRVLLENVVGTGIMPQASVRPELTGCTEAQCAEFNRAAEQYFKEWAADFADANRISDFADLTEIVYRGRLVDGESLAHRVLLPGRGGENRTSFELIDPARLQDPFTGGVNTRQGVEIGDAGQPIAYWIAPQHPDDLRFQTRGTVNLVPERIDRFRGGFWNVLHVFKRVRPGQSRGIPMIAAGLGVIDHLHHYLDSEVAAARLQGTTVNVVERPLDQNDPSLQLEEGTKRDGTGELIFHETFEPGTTVYLNPGEKFNGFAPTRPGATFDPFVVRVLRAFAASLGLSYELVVRDFSSMNYSSARSMLLEARRGFENEQGLLIRTWCRPVWQTVIKEGILRGDLPQFPQMLGNMQAFLAARWIRPAWGWVDPTKEIEASALAVDSNLSTPQGEAARSGLDLEEIYEAKADAVVLRREIERRKGIPEGSLDPASKQPQQQQQPQEDPEEQPTQ